MDSLKKVSQQTLWQLIGKAVTSLSTILVLALISRHYGEADLGVFTLTLTYLSFFYLAADFGFNAHLLRDLQGENRAEVWRKLFGLRILWSAVLVIVALILAPILPIGTPLFYASVKVAVLAIFGSATFVTVNGYLQSRLRYDLSILASSTGAVVTSALIYLLISTSIPTLLLAQLIGWFFCGIASLLIVKRFIKVTPLFDLGFIGKTFKDTLPISVTLLLNVVYFRADAFILSAQKSLMDVGTYNLAYYIFQSILVLPTFIMNGFYPLLLKDLRENRYLFLNNVKKAFFLLLGISIVGTVLTFVFAPTVIQIITGSKGFTGSPLSLRILSYSFPAYFCSSLLMWVLVSLKRYKVMVIIYLIGLVANLFLNLHFIPQYSYLASSYITGISEYLILILQIFILIPILRKL